MMDGIGGPPPLPPRTSGDIASRATAGAPEARAAGTATPARPDTSRAAGIEVGHEVGHVVRHLAGSAPVDSAKVAALKAQIESGTYALDPSAIADAMLSMERSNG